MDLLLPPFLALLAYLLAAGPLLAHITFRCGQIVILTLCGTVVHARNSREARDDTS